MPPPVMGSGTAPGAVAAWEKYETGNGALPVLKVTVEDATGTRPRGAMGVQAGGV
jgi:hypothetical protein